MVGREEGLPVRQSIIDRALVIVREQQVPLTQKDGIWIATVEDQATGLAVTKALLYALSDEQTALFLSGGSTPKPLYQALAAEKQLNAAAVALVDERFGPLFHPDSNEEMIQGTGLPAYLRSRSIPFHPILNPTTQGQPRETAFAYQTTVRRLLDTSTESVAIVGIGDDAHTAGIAPNRPDFHNPLFSRVDERLVDHFEDLKAMKDGGFGARITLTFAGLSRMGLLVPVAFGEKKNNALSRMFTQGSVEEVPARFYRQPEIKAKTLLITDQKI